MIPFIRHPTFEDLNRYADGDLGDTRRARVAAHLADCSDCRCTVSTVRGLGRTARTLPVPTPPDDALSQILAHRDAGDRVLLPVEDIGAPRGRRPIAASVAAAAAVTAFFLAALAVWAPTVRADLSRLTIEPERPPAGETLELSYDGSALFPEQDRLVVRARYRTADGAGRLGSVGQLVRDDGDFRGRIELPDDVVYAAFAVEDLGARQVDSNGRRFWEVLVHDDGKPAYAALRARADELERRDLSEAYVTIRRMTRLYPTQVEGWLRRLTLEKSAYLGGARDSIIDLHWRRFQRFERALTDGPAPPDQIAWMAAYAEALGHPRAREWLERAHARASDHPATLRLFISEATRSRHEASDLLFMYDSLWVAGHQYAWIAQSALTLIEQQRPEPELIEEWVARHQPTSSRSVVDEGRLLADRPETRSEGIRLLNEELNRLRNIQQGDRILYASLAEQEDMNRPLIQHALLGLGAALLEEPGRRRDALHALRAAVAEGWDPAALTESAALLLAEDERDGAAAALARLVVQPGVEIERPELRSLLAESRSSASWHRSSEAARQEFHRYIMSRSVVVAVHGIDDIRVWTAAGQAKSLSSLLSEPATAIAIMTPLALQWPGNLADLQRAARALRARDIPLLALTIEPLSPQLRAHVRQKAPGVELMRVDARMERALNTAGTPDFFIIDDLGRIRFEHVLPAELAVTAAVLRSITSGISVAASSPFDTGDAR